jgi:hypothetical protein
MSIQIPQVIILFSPESSGNRLLARLLIKAGSYGDGDVFQRVDSGIPCGMESVVWIRSIPHGAGKDRHVPDPLSLAKKAKESGYTPVFLTILRNMYCTVQSQVMTGHVNTIEEATRNYREAMHVIGHASATMDYQWIFLTYESLVYETQSTLNWLMPSLGLTVPTDNEHIYPANLKHYQAENAIW